MQNSLAEGLVPNTIDIEADHKIPGCVQYVVALCRVQLGARIRHGLDAIFTVSTSRNKNMQS